MPDHLTPTGTTLITAAVLVTLWALHIRARRIDLPTRPLLLASLVAVLAGILGARLGQLLIHLPATLEHPGRLLRPFGGTASWGAYALGIAAFLGYLRLERHPVAPYADLLASALALGPAIGRLACLRNSCCFGRPTDLPWSITFPAGSHPYTTHLKADLIPPTAPHSLPVHPVQLYAALAALILFLAATRFWHTNRHRPWRTFAFYWLAYGILRFGTEFFRGDVPRVGPLGLTSSQHLAAALVVLGAWGMWKTRE